PNDDRPVTRLITDAHPIAIMLQRISNATSFRAWPVDRLLARLTVGTRFAFSDFATTPRSIERVGANDIAETPMYGFGGDNEAFQYDEGESDGTFNSNSADGSLDDRPIA
ncbi:MAG: hypothetical protein AAGA03_09860, partial [Planctomycetota bacterium]